MPWMDGTATMAALRTDATFGRTPVVLLASGAATARSELAGHGFSSIVGKPVRRAPLLVAATRARGGLALSRAPAAAALPSFALRALVADDTLVNQKVALRMLEKLGCRADAVSNGQEAVRALSLTRYDVVLMDCQMPEMDGFEATAAIRAGASGPAAAATPIVALTANALEGDRQRCLAAGMSDYLTKPVRLEDLADALGRLGAPAALEVAEARARASLAPPPATRSLPPGAGTPAFDQAHFEELLAIDDALGGQLFQSFTSTFGSHLTRMTEAVDAGDAKALARAAHALKGASATLGGPRLQALCQRLETLGKSGSVDGARPLIGHARVAGDALAGEIAIFLGRASAAA
jgi:CheY-like chemotaxis protein